MVKAVCSYVAHQEATEVTMCLCTSFPPLHSDDGYVDRSTYVAHQVLQDNW